jgi:hypothetical protein
MLFYGHVIEEECSVVTEKEARRITSITLQQMPVTAPSIGSVCVL